MTRTTGAERLLCDGGKKNKSVSKLGGYSITNTKQAQYCNTINDILCAYLIKLH
jgi:hypothetical protein